MIEKFVWHFVVQSRQLVLKVVTFCLDTCMKASAQLSRTGYIFYPP